MFLLIPLIFGILWNTFFDDAAYISLRHAQNLAAGRGLASEIEIAGSPAAPQAPLFVLFLAFLDWVSVPLLEASLVLSALGWGMTAVAVYQVGQLLERPVTAWLSAALVVTSPLLLSSLGTEHSWAMALAWLALAFSVRARWKTQTFVLVLLIWAHFDASTLLLAALLWGWNWRTDRRGSWISGLALALAAVTWGALVFLLFGRLTIVSGLNPEQWVSAGQQLWRESEFYGLFLPLAGLGLIIERSRVVSVSLIWALVAVLSGSVLAFSAAAVSVLFLAAVGVDHIGRWLEEQKHFRLDRRVLLTSLAAIAGTLLTAAHLSSSWQRYQTLPRTRSQLDQEVADWIGQHTLPSATVFASSRIGFLADRPVSPDQPMPLHLADLPKTLERLIDANPDLIVTDNSLGADLLSRTGWLQERYQLQAQFASPLDATSRYTVWQYETTDFDLGETHSINVNTDVGVNLTGYRLWPDRIRPGDDIFVTLYFQATNSLTTSLRSQVDAISLADRVAISQGASLLPSGLPLSWWLPDQIIAERFMLTTTPQLPVGAYEVNVSLLNPRTIEFWPLYQNNDVNPIDRVQLGYTAVSWQGNVGDAVTVDALVDEQFRLSAAEMDGNPSPGETLTVKLYWEALRRPDLDFTAYVHLLDDEGLLVAGHDTEPMNGLFPTSAWIPDEIVPDIHLLSVPAQLSPGTYQIKAGFYLFETKERLPVKDRDGIEQADKSIPLWTINIP
jgi:hypothetical protein